MIGKTISHYKIIEKLGGGGMGVVYKARDTKLDRTVALKFLPPHMHLDQEAEKRFISEAKAASSFDHPNICTIYEIDKTDDDQLFIAMAYYEGETLREKLEKGLLKIEDAIDIATQIAEGLNKAHTKGIIHRDIKPANIFITSDGVVKILDFGLAKVSTQTQLTTMGTTMGTVAYMSPEQAKGEAVDHRTDIWSFGIILYEMLTGKSTFNGEYDQAIIYSILNENAEPITGLRSGVPMELERITNKAMEKKPDERYQHIDEILVDLRMLKKNFSSLIKNTLTINQKLNGQKWSKWKEFFPWIITLIAIGIVVILWILLRATASTEQPLVRFVHNLPPGQTIAIEDVDFYGSAITLSPGGSLLVYAATDSGGNTQLYQRPIDQFVSTPIPGTEGASNPFFSPDGQWVGFFSGGRLKKISLLNGVPINICNAQAGYGASWGTDDIIIFSPTYSSGLMKVSSIGGSPKTLTSLNPERGELSHRWPEILPDGKSVLFTIDTGMSGDVKHIAVYSLASGEQHILIREGSNARYAPAGYLIYLRRGSLLAAPFDTKRLKVTGSSVKVLDGVNYSRSGGGQYSFSRNGSLVWIPVNHLNPKDSEFSFPVSFRKAAESSLLWIDRTGNSQRVPTPSRRYWAPSLSPDGKRLALTIDLDIFILEMDRGALTRFTFEGRNHIPVWTPDGKTIAFSSARIGHPPNIFSKMADGSGNAKRLLTSKQHQDPASWSPDGKILAYAELHSETNWDIWMLQLGNKNQSEPFLQTNFNEYHPMISPDGSWIAYTSDESGQSEVYIRSFPSGRGKWLISTEGGGEPLWSADGNELFYRNTGKLMAVPIEKDTTFLAGNSVLLFEKEYEPREMKPFGHPNYDVSLDGRFLIIKPDASASSTQIYFTLNWFEELRQKMTASK